MIKNLLKKPKKIIVSSSLLCLLLIGASYAFFTNSYILTDESLTFGSGLNISYLLEAKTDLSFTIDPLLLQKNGQEYIESNPSTALVMLGNNSEYDNIKCSYEIWYAPKEAYYNSTAASSSNQEMVILGSDSSNQNTAFMFNLNGVNKEEKMADGVIYVRSKTEDITQNWTFTLRHYNLDASQNANLGKTFSGTIKFKPLGCKNE